MARHVFLLYASVTDGPPDEPAVLTVTTTSLPPAEQGVPYSATLAAAGGSGPYTWSLVAPSNVLPGGLALNAATGVISGTPTASGTFAIVARAVDALAAAADSGTINLTVSPASTALSVTTTSLPAAKRGTPFVASVQAVGGTAPYTWSLVAPYNVLPAGVTFNTSSGQFGGAPTAAGTFQVQARVVDALTATADSGLLTLTVDQVDALAIATPSTLPAGEAGAVYPTVTLQTQGGWAPMSWALAPGSALPTGMSLHPSTGDLTGTPTTAGTATFTVRATDSEGRQADRLFTLHVRAAGTSEGPHDYFDYWDTGPGSVYKQYSNSLRTLPKIQSAYADALAVNNWSLDPAMDAVKFTPNWDGVTNFKWGGKQLKFPANQPAPLHDRIILVWDWFWPLEFKINCGTITNYKAFQVRPNGKGWWTNMNNQGAARSMAPNVGFTLTDEFRTAGAANRADGLVSTERVHPAGEGVDTQYTQLYDYKNAIPVDHSVWHRVVIEIRLFQLPEAFTSWRNTYLGGAMLNANPMDAQGRWHMVSKWYMSETMDPTRVLFQVPLGWYTDSYAGPIHDLLFEMDSSKTGAIGPMNGWGRNVLILKNMYADENDANLFRRPVR